MHCILQLSDTAKRWGIFMKKAFAVIIALCMTFSLVACTQSEEKIQDYSINDPEIIYNSSLLSRVAPLKIGNNSDMVELARSLAAGPFVDHIQLYTNEKPYGFEIVYKEFNDTQIQPTSDIGEYNKYYNSVFSTDLAFKRNMFYNSVVVFAIVNNADFVRCIIGSKSFTITRTKAENYLGKNASYYMNNRSIFDTEITPQFTEGSSNLDAFINSLSFDK